MSKTVLDGDGYLRVVAGNVRQVVARLDGERIWFYSKWSKCEIPVTWEELESYHKQMQQ